MNYSERKENKKDDILKNEIGEQKNIVNYQRWQGLLTRDNGSDRIVQMKVS